MRSRIDCRTCGDYSDYMDRILLEINVAELFTRNFWAAKNSSISDEGSLKGLIIVMECHEASELEKINVMAILVRLERARYRSIKTLLGVYCTNRDEKT